jgi:type VI secretion system protein ImpF
MAENSIAERLQPSLLDRLTDEEPGELKETREGRVIDMRRLRDIIQRDLSWLLNTSDHSGELDPQVYPNVARSVVNYGIREVAGELANAERAQRIRASIIRAVELYEPRIKSGTLDVMLRDGTAGGETIIAFDIRADMWAQPLPMELYLRSQVDVTTGELQLERKA